MATRKSTQAAPAASVKNVSKIVSSATSSYQCALTILREIIDEQERVYCIAVAGERSADEEAAIERNLFRVMQGLTQDTQLFNMLRGHLEALARCAGVVVEVQS